MGIKKKGKPEKPKPLSDRVYKSHRQKLAACSRYLRVSRAEALRQAIDAFHLSVFP